MKSTKLMLILLAVALLFVWGCERKVTNQVVTPNTNSIGAGSCMTCHTDNSGNLISAEGEWENSVHASGERVQYTNRASDCPECHVGQGFVDKLTTGASHGPYDMPAPIHCFTCHAPHTTGTMILRASDAYTLKNGVVFNHGEGNLCVNCHHNRTNVNTDIKDSMTVSLRLGPHHGPQGDVLQGTGAWQFPKVSGLTWPAAAPHANAVQDACVGCHMAEENVEPGFEVGGHTWNMINEETGVNLSARCADCHTGVKTYDFPADEDYDHNGTVEGFQTEFVGLLDTLREELIARNLINPETNLADTSAATKAAVKADKNLGGAIWNFAMMEDDRSEGVHNFPYQIAVVQNTITYLRAH